MVQRVDVRSGSALSVAISALLASAARGLLEGTVEHERLNLINARSIAENRGIDLSTTETPAQGNPYSVEVRLSGGMQEIAIAGTAQPGLPPRLTRIGAFHVDIQPRDTLLILTNNDVLASSDESVRCLGSRRQHRGISPGPTGTGWSGASRSLR